MSEEVCVKRVKENRVVGAIKAVNAWFRPKIVPGVTKPEDWVVVRFPSGASGYVETKSLKNS